MDSEVNLTFDSGVKQNCPISFIDLLKFEMIIEFVAYQACSKKLNMLNTIELKKISKKQPTQALPNQI